MELLGTCAVQYANHLYSAKRVVLRTDRDVGHSPVAEFYDVPAGQVFLMRIVNDVFCTKMTSDPRAGAKNRTDIYFFDHQLECVISVLQPLVDSLTTKGVRFDDAPKGLSDPTGLEHPGGLSLGAPHPITSFQGRFIVNYADTLSSISAETNFHIDAERKRGNKLHIGVPMGRVEVAAPIGSVNCFEMRVNYEDTKRLLQAMKIAMTILAGDRDV